MPRSSTPSWVTPPPRPVPPPRWRARRACCAASSSTTCRTTPSTSTSCWPPPGSPTRRSSGWRPAPSTPVIPSPTSWRRTSRYPLARSGERRGAAAWAEPHGAPARPVRGGRRWPRLRAASRRSPGGPVTRAAQATALSAPATAEPCAIAEPDWAAAMAALRDLPADPEILLVCHLNPDGDALGSMLGCGLGLARAGLPARATFPAPFELTPPFDQLPGVELLVDPTEAAPAPDLLICFDAASASRLGELADRLDTAGTSIVVDHHA